MLICPWKNAHTKTVNKTKLVCEAATYPAYQDLIFCFLLNYSTKDFLCSDREWKSEKEVLHFPTRLFYFWPKSQDLPQGRLEGSTISRKWSKNNIMNSPEAISLFLEICAIFHINISFFSPPFASESQHSFHPMDFLNISSQRC